MEDIKLLLIRNEYGYEISLSNNIEKEQFDIKEYLKYGNTFKKVKNINHLINSEFELIDYKHIKNLLNIKEELKDIRWLFEKEQLNYLSYININKEYFSNINTQTDNYLLFLKIKDEKTFVKLKRILLKSIEDNMKENNPFIQIDNINNEKYINYFDKIVILTNNLSLSPNELKKAISNNKKINFSIASFTKIEASKYDKKNNKLIIKKNNPILFFKEIIN